ncbi:MAG: phage protease, partial [Candidatus Paceibacterota bacterium]
MKTKLKNKQAQKFQGVFANMIDIASIVAAEGGKPPKRIQFLPVGSWNTWAYGDVEINQWHLEAMVEAFERGVRKGVPIDVDHDAGAAAGWVTKLTAEEDGLYAEVEWNGKGTELLEDKQYKFFSPEFSFNYIEPATQVSHGPVMIAGSLTNRPLFKEIEALVANESLQGSTDVLLLNQEKNLIIETMQLSEILKKKASELTDEEVAFLKAHESELKKADVKKFSEVLKADEEENEEEEEETNEEEETTEEG